jgi:hypothetical protein
MLLGAAYVAFAYFDLLRHIPGFYCEGFGCIGNGIMYLAIAILIPIAFFVLVAANSEKDKRWRNATNALLTATTAMICAVVCLWALNKARIQRNTQQAIEACKEAQKTLPKLECDPY